MTLRRIPVTATLLVLVAVGVMIRLGFWQLDRLHQKEALIARYQAVATMSSSVPWPASGLDHVRSRHEADFRWTEVDCRKVLGVRAIAGRSAEGESGWSHLARCETANGFNRAEVVMGWSRAPQSPTWAGGVARGVFRMTGQFDARVVAAPPLAGLAANALPNPRNIPNNHFAYAVQWFLFAGVALVIYALALRKRLAAQGTPS